MPVLNKKIRFSTTGRFAARLAAGGVATASVPVYLFVATQTGQGLNWLPLLCATGAVALTTLVLAARKRAISLFRLCGLAVVFVALILVAAVPAPQWIAAAQYDGTLPTAVGCQADANVLLEWSVRAANGHEEAQAQVVRSDHCGTEWIRVQGEPKDATSSKRISRPFDGWLLGVTPNAEVDQYASVGTFSRQVFAPGCVQADVSITEPGSPELKSTRKVCP